MKEEIDEFGVFLNQIMKAWDKYKGRYLDKGLFDGVLNEYKKR